MKVALIKRGLITTVASLALVAAPSGLTVVAAQGNPGGSSADSQADGTHRAKSYVALGDSVAAGLGLPPPPDASAEDQLCGRSAGAYSEVVAATLKKNLEYVNAACSGAVVNHLSTPQIIAGTSIQPQLDTAFASGTPRMMSLTVGANDVHWADFIGACFATTCDTEANTAAATAYLAVLKTNLNSTLASVKARSHGRPTTVVVTGYYHPMSERCVGSNGITASEVVWLNGQTDALNKTIKQATRPFNFTEFAPVTNEFDGHDICSADPWLQRPGVPGEPAAFHPNAQGQQAIAKAVLRSLR